MRLPLFLLLAACMLLGSCGTTDRPRQTAPEESAQLERAEQYYASGQYRQAAQLYQRLAENDPSRRDHWLVLAADAAWQGGFPSLAGSNLQQIDQDALSQRDAAITRLLSVLIYPERYSSINMLDLLRGDIVLWPERYRDLLLLKRAQAYRDIGNHYQAALTLIERQPLLIDADALRRNRTEILDVVSLISTSQASRVLSNHTVNEEIFGWLDLVAGVKSQLFSGGSVQDFIVQWQFRFPDHPANFEAIDIIVENYRIDTGLISDIAVLLPLSGQFSSPARAIRDGILDAYYSKAERGSTLRFYDIGENSADVIEQYRTALEDGAQQIIGPLRKDAVATLLTQARPEISILALNYIDLLNSGSSQTYQLGLSPEQDAIAMADRMLSDGEFRAMVLAPDTAWGERIEASFMDRFTSQGGHIISRYRYDGSQNDYSDVLREVTGINKATVRYRRLRSLLNLPMEFEPQRRDDVDALFLVARPEHGHLIRPQLAFHNAGTMPIYATSHIYRGVPESSLDKDLNGVIFCDAPIVFDAVQSLLERDNNRYSHVPVSLIRLFAIGQDAYRILPYLRWLRGAGNESFPGATGRLQVDIDGRISRLLDCGQFRSGLARPRR